MVVSGIAVFVSMAGLFLANDVIFDGLATGAMLVVGVTVIGSLTVLPAVSVAAAFGVLTLVFQRTWVEGILDFTSTGHIVSRMPLFLFVVLFGLSIGYHVFVVSRIREATAAGVVTSAAAVMVAVFAIFGTLSLIELKQMGIGLAVAIAIDATVIRILLLPSVMALLGRANWWPSRPPRRLERAATVPTPLVYSVAGRS